MKFTRAFFALCFLGLFACGGGGDGAPSQETIAGACQVVGLPAKVIGGVSCGGLDTSSIVRVAVQVDLGGREIPVPVCTGTLISSDDVLTATHCLNFSTLNGLPIVGYSVIVGEPDAAVLYRARRVRFAPGLRIIDGRLINDLAVMQLEAAPPINSLPVLVSESARSGETGFVYGYGRQEEGEEVTETNDFASLQGGAMRIDDVSTEFIQAEFDGSGTNVCNGDSGGPIIVQREVGAVIAGVVSQGSVVGCRPGDVTSFTNASKAELVTWLNGVVPDAAIY